MAMIFRIRYPNGEETHGTGYPGQILTVNEVPAGPEARGLVVAEQDTAGLEVGAFCKFSIVARRRARRIRS